MRFKNIILGGQTVIKFLKVFSFFANLVTDPQQTALGLPLLMDYILSSPALEDLPIPPLLCAQKPKHQEFPALCQLSYLKTTFKDKQDSGILSLNSLSPLQWLG